MSKSVWHKEMCKDEIILDALRKFMSDTTDDEDFAIACEAFSEIYADYTRHFDLYKEDVERERAEAAKAVVDAVTEDKE